MESSKLGVGTYSYHTHIGDVVKSSWAHDENTEAKAPMGKLLSWRKSLKRNDTLTVNTSSGPLPKGEKTADIK